MMQLSTSETVSKWTAKIARLPELLYDRDLATRPGTLTLDEVTEMEAEVVDSEVVIDSVAVPEVVVDEAAHLALMKCTP